MYWKKLLSPQRTGSDKKSNGNSTIRSPFEKDCDRIIFSHPFRKLQDKTQVHPLSEHDFVHTRLTHSLEVSSVGRSLGRQVGGNVLASCSEELSSFSATDFGSIVAAAALAHDLGNPPFGHAGEDGISDFFTHHSEGKKFRSNVTPFEWEDLISFEGNAQGFRILNGNRSGGLKLTWGTLGTFTKYPCPAHKTLSGEMTKSRSKYGFFQSEAHTFSEVADHLGLHKTGKDTWSRHPLAFLVEAADDICYNIIDLEDACRLGLVSFHETLELFKKILEDQFKEKKLEQLSSSNEKVGMLRALAINKLIDECTCAFKVHEKTILNGEFDSSLISKCHSAKALKEVEEMSIEKIYRNRRLMEIQAAGYTALSGLLEAFTNAGQHYIEKKFSNKHSNLIALLPIEIRAEIENLGRKDHYSMLRIIIDFVSGMTDRYAFSLYRKIKGLSH